MSLFKRTQASVAEARAKIADVETRRSGLAEMGDSAVKADQ